MLPPFFALFIISTMSPVPSPTPNAPAPVAMLAVPADAAVIVDAGTPSLAGYRIVVQRSGDAVSVDAAGHSAGRVPANLISRFFAELATAMPLSEIATHPCIAADSSALLHVWWRGERSSDQSCVNAIGAAIAGDARKIARVLYVAEYGVQPMYSRGSPGAAGAITGSNTPAPQPQSTMGPSYPPRI